MLANDLRVLFMKNVWVCFGVWVLFFFNSQQEAIKRVWGKFCTAALDRPLDSARSPSMKNSEAYIATLLGYIRHNIIQGINIIHIVQATCFALLRTGCISWPPLTVTGKNNYAVSFLGAILRKKQQPPPQGRKTCQHGKQRHVWAGEFHS